MTRSLSLLFGFLQWSHPRYQRNLEQQCAHGVADDDKGDDSDDQPSQDVGILSNGQRAWGVRPNPVAGKYSQD